MRIGKRSLLLAISGLAVLSLVLATALTLYVGGVHAASGSVPDDGQVVPKFTTGGGVNGFRTADTIP
jgi:hypothetical protein